MDLLFRVVFATACKSTHHKLALDALVHLREADARGWRRLFLKHYEPYLKGAKAPDDRFKDFKNHVLHVEENCWGGAVKAATDWYGRLVTALREKAWDEAAFAAGVMSHYYSDPLMPFHTGQSEEEGAVHRAAEWSIACAYEEIRTLIEQKVGYPEVEIPYEPTWMETLVKDGASAAHPHYRPLIAGYDLARGVKDPPAGLNRDCRERIAACLAHATVGIARILEQAFYEADVRPPDVSLTLETFLATLSIPVRWVTKKLADEEDRAAVERIYDEVTRTGTAIESLPEDDRAVRRLHADQVLGITEAELNAKATKPKPRAAVSARPAAAPVTERSPEPPKLKPFVPEEPPREEAPRVDPPAAAAQARPLTALPPKVDRPAPPAPSLFGPTPEPTPEPTPVAPSVPPPAGPAVVEAAPRPRPADAPGVPKLSESVPTPVVPVPPAKPAVKLRFYLNASDPIENAPSIGASTAKRFEAIGLRTVADLLNADAEATANRLNFRRLDATAVREYQAQARLCCRVPQLRGHDAQILVACGITEPEAVARFTPEALLAKLEPFLDTPAAERILRGGSRPDMDEVRDWIGWAGNARRLEAA